MDCTVVNLPVVKADFCAPNTNFGQIDKIYLGNLGQDFTDWTVITEWNTRIDNDAAAADTVIRMLHVIGDKPAAESNSVDFSQGRKIYTEKKHTVNIKIDETDDENYALVQWLEANAGQQIAVWYSAGKYLYGGNSGVAATLNLDDIIPESDEELQTFAGTISFEGPHPDRTVNPLA